MILQYTSASLTSEIRTTLSHPSSVDTIPTSEGKEDHVSMGATSARKAIEVVDNLEHILALELLTACQAIDERYPTDEDKNTRLPRIILEIHKKVRQVVPRWTTDRYFGPDISAIIELMRTDHLSNIALSAL